MPPPFPSSLGRCRFAFASVVPQRSSARRCCGRCSLAGRRNTRTHHATRTSSSRNGQAAAAVSPVGSRYSNCATASPTSPTTTRRSYSPTAAAALSGEVADRCNINLVHSPYPPISPGPYPPLYEFVSRHWRKPHHHHHDDHGGHRGNHADSSSDHSSAGGESEYLDRQVAIVDYSKEKGASQQRTFRQYADTATALGTALHDLLLRGGDPGATTDETNSTIALFSPNHVDYLPTVLAVSLMGAKVTPINPVYTAYELEMVLQQSRACVLIAHSTVLDTALKAAKNCPLLKEIVVLTDDDSGRTPVPEGTIDYHQVVHEYIHRSHHEGTDHLLQGTHPIVTAEGTGTDTYPVCMPYSSGTTGLPKGVCLTHTNLVANLLQLESAEGIAFAPGHKVVSPLPFFHIYAFTVSLLYCGWKGHTVITMSDRFDLEEFCKLVEEHQPQRAHLVPPIILGLAKHPAVDRYDLSSLQTIVSAAAPLGKDTEAAVAERLGVMVKQVWGMSELSPLGTWTSDYNAVRGSIGPLMASTTGKVVDDNGKSLPPYEPGELAVKGPQVMLGYLDDPDKTEECLSPNGWLRTGDVAYYDENGFFFITDRIKELIKVRGFPVAPAELEELLLTHPDVGDAAVIGLPDEASGELPRAYVVLKPGHEGNVTEQGIGNWVEERVAHYKRLKGGIVFTDAIPKSASGKILRRVLRDGLTREESESEKQ